MKHNYFSGPRNRCHICGYGIPQNIVSKSHPLFGTVDHVMAKAAGGSDALSNKLASHRLCNEKKLYHDLTFQLRHECRVAIRQFLLDNPNLSSVVSKPKKPKLVNEKEALHRQKCSSGPMNQSGAMHRPQRKPLAVDQETADLILNSIRNGNAILLWKKRQRLTYHGVWIDGELIKFCYNRDAKGAKLFEYEDPPKQARNR